MGSGFLSAVGEQLAAPGFAVEQLTQEAGDFAFTRARIKQPCAGPRWKRDEPGSRSFCHVWRVWVIPAFFDTCKSHVCILRVNSPQEDATPRGTQSPRGERFCILVRILLLFYSWIKITSLRFYSPELLANVLQSTLLNQLCMDTMKKLQCRNQRHPGFCGTTRKEKLGRKWAMQLSGSPAYYQVLLAINSKTFC